MPLVLGSVKFIVTHGLCCFMGLSTSQQLCLWGNAQNHFLLGGITVCVDLTWSCLCYVYLCFVCLTFDPDGLQLGFWPAITFQRMCGGFDIMWTFFIYCYVKVMYVFVVVNLIWCFAGQGSSEDRVIGLVQIKVRNKIAVSPAKGEDEIKSCK